MTKKEIIANQQAPAFPCDSLVVNKGMTKLELVAAICLAGCLANSQYRMVDQKEIEAYAIDKAETVLTLMHQKKTNPQI